MKTSYKEISLKSFIGHMVSVLIYYPGDVPYEGNYPSNILGMT